MRYRFELQNWYGILLSCWLTLMLPVACVVLAVGGSITSTAASSLDLLFEGPLGIALFLLFWSPLLAAPFGLFERIY